MTPVWWLFCWVAQIAAWCASFASGEMFSTEWVAWSALSIACGAMAVATREPRG